jgi:hypothetical protein
MTDAELDQAMTTALRALDMPRFEQLAAEADRRAAAVRARLDQPGALLTAALWYAEQGMPVFPCEPGGKRPITTHGFQDASAEPDVIREWWARTPAANIGLPTGGRYDVIDVDGPTGYRSLARLKSDRLFPEQYAGRVLTPRGGMHIYIEPTGAGNSAGIKPGVDYRGAGGYVLAPPSVGANGRRWQWCNPLNTSGYSTVYTWEVPE